jgi:signal peptidase I
MEPLVVSSRSTDLSRNDTQTPVPQEPTPEQRQSGFIAEIFKFAIMALLIVVPFRMFIAQPFIVSGASMEPTFRTGQYLIIDQLSYRLDEPMRGDVVIFRFPQDPSKFFIKRIIGLPGERVQVSDGIVRITHAIDEEPIVLAEPYLTEETQPDDHVTITLEEDEYFVMGDNRPASSDSRVWGPVPRKNIVGKALVRLLPFTAIGLYPGEYHSPIDAAQAAPY